MLQATERKENTDLQQLNFWLDRRFGSSERFSALTWFQHLPGNRFSIHLYPLLWSTSTWAACSQVPAQIWASGAAPAITAGIHPGKAIPATSCHCSKNQQTLRKRKNLSLLPHFPKGKWTAPQRLGEEVQLLNLKELSHSKELLPNLIFCRVVFLNRQVAWDSGAGRAWIQPWLCTARVLLPSTHYQGQALHMVQLLLMHLP